MTNAMINATTDAMTDAVSPDAGGERDSAPMPEGIETWPGRFYPLGAAYDGAGTNFSLFSEVAEGVELCLFDDDGG